MSFMLNGQLTAAQTVAVDTSQRGIPQNQDLAFTGTLSAVTTTTPLTTTSEIMTTSTPVPEFPALALSLLAALGVAFATLYKKTRR